MGDALVVAVIPEEVFSVDCLVTTVDDPDDPTREVRVRDLYDDATWWALRRDPDAIRRRHPRAHYVVPIGIADVWRPPAEQDQGVFLEDHPVAKARHAKAVKRSLESFLNARIARLAGALRTGWWILDEARVRVTRMRGRR